MDAEPVVAVWRQEEVKLEDIVAVLLLADEVLAAADDNPALDLIGSPCPFGQVPAVKKADCLLGA